MIDLEKLLIKCPYTFGRERLHLDISGLTPKEHEELWSIWKIANEKTKKLIAEGKLL